MSNAQELLTHLKTAILKFNAGYQLVTEAKQEMDTVYRNFKLGTIETPEVPQLEQQTQTPKQAGAIEVALWKASGLGATKYNGRIDGTDLMVRLFEGKKEGVLLSGGVVPKDSSEGSFTDNSVAYVMIKQRGNAAQMSIKFDAIDTWYNGDIEKVDKTNDKMPDLRCTLVPSTSTATAPKANTLALLESPAVQETQENVNEALGLTVPQESPVLPWDEPVKSPTADELLNTPDPTVLTKSPGDLPTWLLQ